MVKEPDYFEVEVFKTEPKPLEVGDKVTIVSWEKTKQECDGTTDYMISLVGNNFEITEIVSRKDKRVRLNDRCNYVWHTDDLKKVEEDFIKEEEFKLDEYDI